MYRKLRPTLTILCVLFFVFSKAQICNGPLNGNYTINKLQPTSGGNFNSFSDAVAALNLCGVSGPVLFTVTQGSGPYNERVVINPVNNASATNTVTFSGNGETISYGTTDTAEHATIKLNGADHIVLEHLVINAIGSTAVKAGIGIQLSNRADSNVISQCSINLGLSTTTAFAGITINTTGASATTAMTGSTCNGNLIMDDTVNGGGYSITTVGTATATNKNNQIIGNYLLNNSAYGVYSVGSENLLVEANNITRPDRTANVTNNFAAIQLGAYNRSSKVSKNIIHNLLISIAAGVGKIYGISLSSCKATLGNENEISNNLVYDLRGNGSVAGIYHTASEFTFYYHNTISLDHAASTAAASTFTKGAHFDGAQSVRFIDNIITVSRGGASAKTCIDFGTMSAVQMNSFVSDNNDLYYGAAQSATNGVGYAGSSVYVTLNDWQTALSKDVHSVSFDPQYSNAAVGYLLPTSLSIDNIGQPLGLTTDIAGNARSSAAPDAGAYEFGTIPFCNAPANVTLTDSIAFWNATAASGYEYSIDQNLYAPASGTNTTDTFTLVNNLTRGAVYYLHVRANCSAGLNSAWVTSAYFVPCNLPQLIITGSRDSFTFCQGDSILLKGNVNPGYTYQWRKNGSKISGATNANYMTHLAGVYELIVAAGPNCIDTSASVNVVVMPLPVPVISYNNGTFSVDQHYSSYQWKLSGNAISGATDSTYTPPQKGTYSVTVTNANGCTGTSAKTTINTTGVEEISGADAIAVYPNPTSGIIQLQAKAPLIISVFNSEGKILLKGENGLQIDLSMLPAGLYWLRLANKEGITVKTIPVTKN
ncbi:T9SS type A sorting domain-containing protein [Taibaiella soli]|uniref:Secretion system C-terminal sorting domain-containing protein n=1 Tax=Taibaiella soli TaxID=1649169 RepID=A0A2W2AGJ6_9BACT|nr:T9SS type A sorting domain-containing protein [Taibaiella soli]PZF71380.1 hypothetical protein DN068_19000 [Taibaiella soli]